MRRRQTAGDLFGITDRGGHRQRLVPQSLAQRLAFQHLADDVWSALLRANVMDAENIRMIQRTDGSRLLFEAAL